MSSIGWPVNLTLSGITIDILGGPPATMEGDPGHTVADGNPVATGTVPVGKQWKFYYARCVCRNVGFLQVNVDGAEKARLDTSAAESNPQVGGGVAPFAIATQGQVVTLDYTNTHGPAVNDLAASLTYVETSI